MADELEREEVADEADTREAVERAVTLEDVHRAAWEERQKAPVMDDPTISTAGTAEEVKERMAADFEDELERRFSPATTPAQAQTDSAHNPTASRPTVDESGEEQDPVGGVATEHVDVSEEDDDYPTFVDAPADEEDAEEARDGRVAADSAYDSVTTSNDIRLDTPEGEDVDTEGATPVEDTEELADREEDDEAVSQLDSSVDNREEGNLDALTKTELLNLATEKGVEVDDRATKAEIKDALRNS